jgi:hypothetical protein
VDPLNPITPGGAAPPSRRVPPVDRLRRITREGDRPDRERRERESQRREPSEQRPEREDGEGHIDIRV